LDEHYWTLLHGDPAEVRQLAAVLGINYEKLDGEQLTHSNLVTILNRDGEIVYQQMGAGSDPRKLVHVIEQAMSR
jgi:protein SCO1/2